MHETKLGGMEHHARGLRLVDDLEVTRRRIHALAAHRMPRLRQVNPDLMRAARLQAAFDERVGIPEVLDRPHVRDRGLALFGAARAAPAIAPVADQVRADRARADAADTQGEIAAVRGVRPKLLRENPFGRHRASEHHEAARLAVDPVHRPHRRLPARLRAAGFEPPREILADRVGHHLVERGLHLPPAGRPRLLFGMARGGDARRLLDHHHLVVEVHDADVVGLRGRGGGSIEHLHHLALLQPPGHIGADVAVNHHVPRANELLHAAPARPAELRPQECRERLPLLGGRHVMHLARSLFHLMRIFQKR
jgi:hypothetical protein